MLQSKREMFPFGLHSAQQEKAGLWDRCVFECVCVSQYWLMSRLTGFHKTGGKVCQWGTQQRHSCGFLLPIIWWQQKVCEILVGKTEEAGKSVCSYRRAGLRAVWGEDVINTCNWLRIQSEWVILWIRRPTSQIYKSSQFCAIRHSILMTGVAQLNSTWPESKNVLKWCAISWDLHIVEWQVVPQRR
jgi:hypothetical protein